MSLSSVPSYKPGDLSRLLSPSAGAPVLVSATAAADPTFFGYLRPTKGRPPSRKSAKGGGKFSKETLSKKAKGKKAEAKTQQERHKKEVAEAAERKRAAKQARSDSGRPKAKQSADGDESKESASEKDGAEDGEQEEDEGMDESDGDVGDDVDEAAVEAFMKDIEAEDGGGDDAEDDDGSDADEEDPEVKAKRERIAKRDKRLAEDAEAEKPLPKQKDINKQRKESRENDIRLPRTIFVGNVPCTLKSSKLTHWIESSLGHDSSTAQSIVESIRFRSVAVSDPKVPKKIAVQKGMLHEARDSMNAYVVFREKDPWVERAVKELSGRDIELDGKKWRLRIDFMRGAGTEGAEGGADATSASKPSHDNAHTIFVGNLPFSVNENDLYAHFESCGPVRSVRVIRDAASQMGKGIAFVTLGDAQSMRNALAFHDTKFGAGERKLRIMRAVENKKLHKVDSTGAASGKKGAAAAGAGSSKGKDGKSSGARKEGYGGAGKVKEINRAGVLKKPRHKPRDGSAPTVQPSSSSNTAPGRDNASSAAYAQAAAAATLGSAPPKRPAFKRAFEGEHADPTEHSKRARVESVKKVERKEKKRENKKISSAPSAK